MSIPSLSKYFQTSVGISSGPPYTLFLSSTKNCIYDFLLSRVSQRLASASSSCYENTAHNFSLLTFNLLYVGIILSYLVSCLTYFEDLCLTFMCFFIYFSPSAFLKFFRIATVRSRENLFLFF